MRMPLMKCGHTAQGVDENGNPVCVICYGINAGATEIADTPDLEGRKARCAYYGKKFRDNGRGANECPVCDRQSGNACRCERPSSIDLPFFEWKPDEEFDLFYCGCHGWD